jgi:hypothetical protein
MFCVKDVYGQVKYTEISMLKRNKILIALMASASTLTTASIHAAETVNATASVTVQNAFELVESTQLSFGTITIAKAVGTQGTSPADPKIELTTQGESTATSGDVGTTPPAGSSAAKISSIVSGTPATFDIANASPFTVLTVTAEIVAGTKLSNSSAGSTNGKFTLSAFKLREAGESADISSGGTITTLLDGTSSFNVGATLTAESDKDYIDGVYSGSYTVKVSY